MAMSLGGLPQWCGWRCVMCDVRGQAQTDDEAYAAIQRHYQTTEHRAAADEIDRRSRLTAAAPAMLALLRELEWVDRGDGERCSDCEAPRAAGHLAGCALGALLASIAKASP